MTRDKVNQAVITSQTPRHKHSCPTPQLIHKWRRSSNNRQQGAATTWVVWETRDM